MKYESQEEHDHFEGAMEQSVPQEEAMPLPVTECKLCGRKSEIVDMNNCPFCKNKTT
jgi:hypothetical protein